MRGKGGIGNGIFEWSLGVGGEEAYCGRRGGVKRMWKEDFAWFEPLLVDNMFLGGENQPDWFGGMDCGVLRTVNRIGEEVFGRRRCFFALCFRLDVFEECAGGFECLCCC